MSELQRQIEHAKNVKARLMNGNASNVIDTEPDPVAKSTAPPKEEMNAPNSVLAATRKKAIAREIAKKKLAVPRGSVFDIEQRNEIKAIACDEIALYLKTAFGDRDPDTLAISILNLLGCGGETGFSVAHDAAVKEGYTVDELRSSRRNECISFVRKKVMWTVRKKTGMFYTKIGLLFRRDAATARYNVMAYQAILDAETQNKTV